MIYIPNSAVIAPPSGNWGGGFEVESAFAHNVLLGVPFRTETIDFSRFGPSIPGGLHSPPPSVIAAIYAKKWKIDVDVAGPGGGTRETLQVDAGSQTWGEVLKSGQSLTAEAGNPDFSGGVVDYTSVKLSLEFTSFAWSDPTGWWPGFQCLIDSRTYAFPSPPIRAVQASQWDRGHGATGIEVKFADEDFQTFYGFGGDSGLSGSIVLEPIEWLEVI
jgi:hypothetical protein